MVGKEPFGNDSLDPGSKEGGKESGEGSDKVGYPGRENFQPENVWVEVGDSGTEGRDITRSKPEMLSQVSVAERGMTRVMG